MTREDRLLGALLGVAIGDALGLPYEGMSSRRVARAKLDRFRLIGRTGFVSDDTEQTALLAQSLARGEDDAACLRRFRRAMVGWFARLPFGVGLATLRACVRMMLGLRETGISSAGNGAAMRAGILGVFLAEEHERRRNLARAFATLTHTDERAVQAAAFVAEVSAYAIEARSTAIARALEIVTEPQLRAAIERGVALAQTSTPFESVVRELGNTGFVVHSMALCVYCFLAFDDSPIAAIEAAIRAGGDTDTHAAIVGGWMGARHGALRLPPDRVHALHDGPFGPTHLRRLAEALAHAQAPPRWSAVAALARNLALYPVVLGHGLARLWPWFVP